MDFTSLVYIDSTGFFVADFPTFLNFFQQSYLNIYGQDVVIDPTTQDGQFISILAQAAFDSANVAQATYNSFSPITAQGAGLASVVAINGIQKEVPSNSSVDVVIIGQVGTVLTNSIAIDTLQQQWNIPSPTTIPGGGTITVTAIAQNPGAINAEANTVTGIFTPTLGWQSVNNPSAATPGAPVETDAQLRIRQQESVANPSLTVFEGTIGGVANLAGVQKIKGYENDTEATDGNGLPAHSICVVVLGGDDMQIAQEIQLHKTPGTTTFGSTSETVYDSKGMPLIINFQRPVTAEIQVQITLAALTGWSSDYEATIAEAVAAVINGNSIGADVIISQLYAPAYLIGTAAGLTYQIATIEIGKNGGGLGTSNIDLVFDENAVCDASIDITFVVT